MNPLLSLSQYGLSEENVTRFSDHFILVEKKNWDYNLAHDFQQDCVSYIREHRKVRIFIICNHPHCFTLGRGLQKNKELQGVDLIDFNPELRQKLTIPLYDIKRGGGLTFHYPGQLICYPICSLGQKLDVYKVMNYLLDIAKETLIKNYGLTDLSYKEKLLGLWWNQKKMASIGIAVTRFITYHGMALNVLSDNVMNQQLQKVYPCGLPGSVYVSAQEVVGQDDIYDQFWDSFKNNLIARETASAQEYLEGL
ncbi:MAG: lipoyl protein ligase domain-containing protein [Bacteriovoracaceae bacterium]